MKTEKTASLTDHLIELLETTKVELEQFRNEVADEKADVNLKYEELKNELFLAVQEMKDLLQYNKNVTQETARALKTHLEDLETQLEASADVTSVNLKTHLINIKGSLEKIVKDLGKQGMFDEALSTIHDRVIRFKIKAEILRLKFELGKMNVKDVVKDQSHEISQKIRDLKKSARETEHNLEKKWKGFSKELSETYSHIQKSFTR